eukprot:TRINITY_DN6389_c0_g4_i1.p1 TRINITY_DN6389_c0_g4~~TRINITY_DN6389_c0_g4_i1.p1  ORF type:complete len:638 (-),score=80.90 TRINITY_DN6389_c0_g4_i1:271-2184(-)
MRVMRTDAESIAVLALAVVTILLYFVVVGCLLKRKLQRKGISQCCQDLKERVGAFGAFSMSFISFCKVCVGARARFGTQKSDSEKKMEAVAQEVHDEKLKHFQQKALILAAPVMVYLLVFHAFEITFTYEGTSLADFHAMQIVLVILFATCCLVSDRGPSRYASMLWHILSMAELLYTTFKLASSQKGHILFQNDRANVITVRLCHSVLARDLHLGVVLNLVYGISSLTTVWLLKVPGNMDKEYGGNGTWMAVCSSEIVITFTLCLFVLVLQDRSMKEARALVEAQSSQTGYRAVSKLLASICDVVLEIDHNLVIAEDASKLASMLLHSRGKSMKGLKITEFMTSDADKEAFETLLRSTASGGEATSSHPMQLRMRDSTSTSLEVEVFHTLVQDLDSKKGSFVIGIRELSESEQSHVRQFGSAEVVADAEAAVERMVRARTGAKEECTSLRFINRSDHALRSRPKVIGAEVTDRQRHEEIWVLINVASMRIQAASSKFAAYLDELDGPDVATLFNDTGKHFSRLCQLLMNTALHDDDGSDTSPEFCIDHLNLLFRGNLVKGTVSPLVPVAGSSPLPILMRFHLRSCRSRRVSESSTGSTSSDGSSCAGTPRIIGRSAQGLLSDLGSGPDGDKFRTSI